MSFLCRIIVRTCKDDSTIIIIIINIGDYIAITIIINVIKIDRRHITIIVAMLYIVTIIIIKIDRRHITCYKDR